jgi:hypothetical protein
VKSIREPRAYIKFLPITVLFLLLPLHFAVLGRPNLALFRPVTSSSVGEDNPPGKAVNGVLTDRWESLTTDSEWICVDLGVAYAVDSVFVNWETAAGQDYAIQTATALPASENGWATAAHITDGAQGEKRSITFASVQARYVRLKGYKRASIFGYSIWEFEVYGTAAACIPPVVAAGPDDRTFVNGLQTAFYAYANGTDMSFQWQRTAAGQAPWADIALAASACLSFKPVAADSGAAFRCIISSSCGKDTSDAALLALSKKAKINLACKKPAKCTSYEGTDMTAAAAVDDDSATRWGGNYKTDPNKDSAWLYVDLGAVYTIDSVFINWEHSGSKEYYVQTANVASDNDQGWTNVAHITDGNAWEKRPIKFNQTQARFVRVRCLKRISDFSYSIFELEVYAPKSTQGFIDKKNLISPDGYSFDIKRYNGYCIISAGPGLEPDTRVKVFSLQGRLIRTLFGSCGMFVWDYRDVSGTPVKSGMYMVSVVSGTKTMRSKCILCR